MAETGVEALIFDVDGTLAETEELHRAAFNRAFAAAGLPYRWEPPLYRRLLEVAGGRRRIERYLTDCTELPPDEIAELAPRLHAAKNAHYAEAMTSTDFELRPGVEALVASARSAGLRLAIATTTSRSNLDGLLSRFAAALPRAAFEVIVCGEDVAALKPDPEAYLVALDGLGLAGAACLAFEDSVNGLRSAIAAGIPVVVTPGLYTSGGDFGGAWLVLDDLRQFSPGEIARRGK